MHRVNVATHVEKELPVLIGQLLPTGFTVMIERMRLQVYDGADLILEHQLLQRLYQAGQEISRFSRVMADTFFLVSQAVTDRLGWAWPTLQNHPAGFEMRISDDKGLHVWIAAYPKSKDRKTEIHERNVGYLTWEPMDDSGGKDNKD